MASSKWHIRCVDVVGEVSRTGRGRLVSGIHHVRLATPDIDRLLRFYRETIGLEIIATFGHFVDGREVVLACGNLYLNLLEDRRRVRARRRARSQRHGGSALCFEVTELDAIRELLERAGIAFEVSGGSRIDGTRTLRTRDPDDNVVEFLESRVADDPLGLARLTPAR